MNKLEFKIEKTWDDQGLDHSPVKISLEANQNECDYINLTIEAPFFKSPAKPEHSIGEFFNLWDYEVVEIFFLAPDSGKYLELEFGPYGHYVALLLQSPGKNIIEQGFQIQYVADLSDIRWIGKAKIHEKFFPKKVKKINAYAIHGESNDRKYEALYPVPFKHFSYPDFHRIEYFKSVDIDLILKNNSELDESQVWKI